MWNVNSIRPGILICLIHSRSQHLEQSINAQCLLSGCVVFDVGCVNFINSIVQLTPPFFHSFSLCCKRLSICYVDIWVAASSSCWGHHARYSPLLPIPPATGRHIGSLQCLLPHPHHDKCPPMCPLKDLCQIPPELLPADCQKLLHATILTNTWQDTTFQVFNTDRCRVVSHWYRVPVSLILGTVRNSTPWSTRGSSSVAAVFVSCSRCSNLPQTQWRNTTHTYSAAVEAGSLDVVRRAASLGGSGQKLLPGLFQLPDTAALLGSWPCLSLPLFLPSHLLFCPRHPLIRTLVMTLNPPRQSRMISQLNSLITAAKSQWPRETQSQIPDIRTWTPGSGGVIILPPEMPFHIIFKFFCWVSCLFLDDFQELLVYFNII